MTYIDYKVKELSLIQVNTEKLSGRTESSIDKDSPVQDILWR